MGNQCSEMKGQFRAEPEAISTVVATSANAQPPVLCDHFKDGPTKVYRQQGEGERGGKRGEGEGE